MTRFRLLLIALVLSLLLHLMLLGSDLLPALSLQPEETPKLEKIDIKMQAMQLDTPAPLKPSHAGVQLRPSASKMPPKPVEKPAPKRRKKTQASQAAEETAEASAPAQETLVAQASSEPVAELPPAEHPARHQAASEPARQPARAAQSDTSPTAGFIHPDTAMRKFPVAARIRYQGFWGQAMVGFGDLEWLQGDGRYQLDISVNPFIGPKLRYLSQGQIDSHGLRPDTLQAFRGGQLKDSARFDYDAGLLRYGDSAGKQLALKNGAQDAFSLAFQLALKGGDLGRAPIQITTAKKVYEYPMAPAGAFDYDTGDGKMRVIVFRAEGDGDVTEFWLAPDFANLPVRILRADKDKRIELKAIRIEVNGKRQWELPPQPTIRNKNAH
ncbi:hypothetical protein BI343_13995 [Chromobacterium amazonense]|uniref:DUF3108 domain-containing protein n=1 Tax=Chromobacterium amazonense TaxID=1382803 RepID=UPI0008DA5F3D|nr:DUF3108 domain-containing protein [Chromobacterium amazonense]OHX16800.1 hypothetical protein BI343_13995 [Chromobacterium amazonense]